MRWELSLTILGTIVTIIGTGITIVQAKRVREYREEIRVDRLKVFLIESITASEAIKKASRNLRTPVNREFARGFDMQDNIDMIENYLCDIKELAFRFELDEIKKCIMN